MDSPFALNVRQTIDRENRRLRAVMFTDLAGFTALIEADERRGLNARDRNMRSVDTHHAAFGGRSSSDSATARSAPFPVHSTPYVPGTPISVSSRRRCQCASASTSAR
jgi:class 3 adenylate cyclase